MSDVKSKFEAALAQRKKQKTEEAARGNFAGTPAGFADIPYAPLYAEKQQAFRFVGLPHLVREKPTDSKRAHIAMILADDDKKFRCIGPDPAEQKDWILYRLMNKVLSRRWDKNIPGMGGQLGAYVYDYASVHPELFNRVSKNNNAENALEKGWKFGPCIFFNVIDRANYGWHLENKKMRVLSKKASEWQDKFFFEPGVPDAVFQLIMDDIVAVDGNTNWEDYDIVIRKVKEKPWYKVYHGVDDMKKLDEDVRALIVQKGLSDEERSWEMNDFDKLFPVTRYAKIKSKLGLFFQKADKIFGTKYYDELVSLVEKEEAEDAERRQEPQQEDAPAARGLAAALEKETPPPALSKSPAPDAAKPPPSPPLRAAAEDGMDFAPMTDAVWRGLADGTYNGRVYLGVPKMKEHEKALVLGVHPDGSFEWHPDSGELLEGSSSQFVSPASLLVDPLDGTVFPPI